MALLGRPHTPDPPRVIGWADWTARKAEAEYRAELATLQEDLAELVAFAYNARKRGWRVEVLPVVEPPAAPDVLVTRDENAVYVEVELGREKHAKWRNLFDLQQEVALCTLTPQRRMNLVREVKSLSIAGRATDLESLIKGRDEGGLWVETWD